MTNPSILVVSDDREREIGAMEDPMDRFGIDIGRVIIGPSVAGRADTSFLGSRLEDAMHTPPADGSFDTIRDLVARSGGNAWLVSKCGPGVQKKTVAWLAHHGFHEHTGMPPDHVRFCLERKEKAVHAKRLGLTVFVDDRLDVLQHLRGIVPRLLWFGEDAAGDPDWVEPARDWEAVRRLLLA
jgi:hypothetical protein